jgi:hypothetical protein
VRRCADDPLEECDRVLRHQLVGDWALDIRGPPVATPLRREHVEVRGQRVEVRGPRPGVGPAGVEQHQRLALAVLVIPGTHLAKLHVACHRGNSPLGFWSLYQMDRRPVADSSQRPHSENMAAQRSQRASPEKRGRVGDRHIGPRSGRAVSAPAGRSEPPAIANESSGLTNSDAACSRSSVASVSREVPRVPPEASVPIARAPRISAL